MLLPAGGCSAQSRGAPALMTLGLVAGKMTPLCVPTSMLTSVVPWLAKFLPSGFELGGGNNAPFAA